RPRRRAAPWHARRRERRDASGHPRGSALTPLDLHDELAYRDLRAEGLRDPDHDARGQGPKADGYDPRLAVVGHAEGAAPAAATAAAPVATSADEAARRHDVDLAELGKPLRRHLNRKPGARPHRSVEGLGIQDPAEFALAHALERPRSGGAAHARALTA